MKTTSANVTRCLCILIGLTAGSALAAPPTWWDGTAKKGWINNLPDFYQHQAAQEDPVIPFPYPAGNPNGPQANRAQAWQFGGGWCAGVAILNNMYQWSTRHASMNNLIRDGDIRQDTGKWITPMRNNIAYTAVFGALTGTGVNAFIDMLGYGAGAALMGDPALQYAEYRVAQDGGDKGKVIFQSHRGAVTVKIPKISNSNQKREASAFDFIRMQMLADRTVNPRIGAKNAPDPDGVLWWKGPNIYGGHYHLLSAAGIDAGAVTDTKFNGTIWFADPDSNKGSKTENAGAEWVPRTISGQTRNESKVPAARKYNATDDPNRPIPARDGSNPKLLAAGFDKFYGFMTLEDDGFTVKSSDTGASGKARYEKTTITAVGTMGAITAVKAAGSRGSGDDAPVESLLRITNSVSGAVDQVMIFPDKGVVPGEMYDMASIDPYDLAAPLGGAVYNIADFAQGSMLHPGQSLILPITTLTDFNFFDVFIRDSETNTWFASAHAADNSLDVYYELQAPTPSAITLAGLGLLLISRRKR